MGQTVKTKHAAQPSRSMIRSLAAFIFVGIVAVGLAMWWMSDRVELDEHGYDLTLALYRVCNQQSIEGLEQIESQFSDPQKTSSQADRSFVAISRVIEKAKRGQWSEAQQDCRRLMEDQVKR